MSVDLSVRAGGLNTGQMYSGSGKIRVGCISDSGKIQVGVFRFYEFRINPTAVSYTHLTLPTKRIV